MRSLVLTAVTFAASSSAFAHPGHLDAVSGHDHYIVVGAAALAVAIGLGALIVRARAAKR